MEREKSNRRLRGPMWCLSLLVLAGCHSIPPADMVMRARSDDIVRAQMLPAYSEGAARAPQPIPICFDTVFRLALDQNGQVRLARMRLEDAESDQTWASKHWMPDLSVGMGAWRHDGGIQDFYGNLIKSDYTSALAGMEIAGRYDWKEILLRRVEAERRVWQQRADVSKLSSENLLEAATTYVDLLGSRTGIVFSLETEIRLRDLLEQARALAKVDEGLRVEVSRIETELMAQTVLTVKLREASKAATAKLAYLFGLDPCCDFVVADKALVPISIIDAKQPVHQLVEQALTKGPGVRELEGLLHVVEEARNSNYGWTHWMPCVELNAVEGGFGAGPNTTLDWTNRFELGVKLKWSLTELAASKQKRQQADRNIAQVHLSYRDLCAKLTLGVQEARDAIQSGQEQIQLAEKHIGYAEESHRLSDARLKQNIKGRSSSEVLLALRALGGAKLEYLQSVRDFDKAQLRLFVLVGATQGENKK